MARSKELSAAFFSFVIWTVHISRVNLWAHIILCKYTNVGSIDIKGQKSSKLNLFVLSIYIFFGQKSFEDSNSFNNNNSSVIGTSRLKCLTKIALAKVDTYTNLNFFSSFDLSKNEVDIVFNAFCFRFGDIIKPFMIHFFLLLKFKKVHFHL